jgi:esterase/lipase
MDRASSGVIETTARTLVLYGVKDDIIPRGATCEWLQSLPPDDDCSRQTLIYQDGYHMLTRDLQAEVVLKDMVEWINGGDGHLVSHDGLVSRGSFCQ